MFLQIGRYIQSRGGTVVAEELAPFLDLQPNQLAADRGSRVTGACSAGRMRLLALRHKSAWL